MPNAQPMMGNAMKPLNSEIKMHLVCDVTNVINRYKML